MDENKMIRPMDFVRLTNIDELNVIKDTKNHIGLVKEVSRDGSMGIVTSIKSKDVVEFYEENPFVKIKDE